MGKRITFRRRHAALLVLAPLFFAVTLVAAAVDEARHQLSGEGRR